MNFIEFVSQKYSFEMKPAIILLLLFVLQIGTNGEKATKNQVEVEESVKPPTIEDISVKTSLENENDDQSTDANFPEITIQSSIKPEVTTERLTSTKQRKNEDSDDSEEDSSEEFTVRSKRQNFGSILGFDDDEQATSPDEDDEEEDDEDDEDDYLSSLTDIIDQLFF